MNAFEIPVTDEQLPDSRPWHSANTSGDQGLIISEDGENIAVTYKAENARLVAAAPELLEALKKVGELICDSTADEAVNTFGDTFADFTKAGLSEADYQQSLAFHVLTLIQSKCLTDITTAINKAGG